MEDYRRLIIRGISYSQSQSGAYALLLEDEITGIKLPVIIGSFEAQSISLGLEKDIKIPRPLTHDLFTHFIEKMQCQLLMVDIYKIVDGVFFSNIIFKNSENQKFNLEARVSDAVALAVRFQAPIYTNDKVLNEAGILLEIESEETEKSEKKSNQNLLDDDDQDKIFYLKDLSQENLEQLLEQAVKEEDFDTALKIQEELKKRNLL